MVDGGEKWVRPDQRKIGKIQASRLARLSALDERELAGMTVAELDESLRFRIDPELLLFRRVCGKVVKTNPETGAQCPVPFATVHVEDTDCRLLGYFPKNWPYGWYYILSCSREEIATAVTDECGRFCVYIPRWEIDWILRWRRIRICFPIIFTRPTIGDVIKEIPELLPDPPVLRRPPLPDPPPLAMDGGISLHAAETVLGREVAEQLAIAQASAEIGGNDEARQAMLQRAVPRFAPPVPERIHKLAARDDTAEMARELGVEAKLLQRFRPDRYIGPFRRCYDVYFPQWQAFFDVPDVTFRVTQDVDGDGDEEEIYGERLFDVRWDAGSIPDVTLEASQEAICGEVCDAPGIVCEDEPAILFAGLMPLVNAAPPEPPPEEDPFFDAATGYAQRPNRPHPSGDLTSPTPIHQLPLAQTPFASTVHLYGCSEIGNAKFYRLLYRYQGGPEVPFTGRTWPLYRVVGGSLQTYWPTADANGWYSIVPAADGWFPQNLLLSWPTGSYQNGFYEVRLELGNPAKNPIATSVALGFRIDNTKPTVRFTRLRWRAIGDAWTPDIGFICPVIKRPLDGAGNPRTIDIELSYEVTAEHLRSIQVDAGGCGGGTPTRITPVDTAEHWHQTASDNSYSNVVVYRINGGPPAVADAPGAYSFSLLAVSRAFNPAGGDSGHLSNWNYNPVHRWAWPRFAVAVVNE